MGIVERIDAITGIPAERRRAVLPAPKAVKIELSGRCNYRCGFCALRLRDKQPTADMAWHLFTRLADEMRAAGVEELGLFFLGESFTNPGLLREAVHYAKKKARFPYVFLTTNGSLCRPAFVEAVMLAGLDSLKFSINAATPEQFEEIMGVKRELYHLALANLKAARQIRDAGGHRCGLYASSIMYDGEQGARMQALLKARVLPYVDEHYFLPLYSMGAFATQREAELGYRPIAGNQGRLGALREPLPCWSAFTEGHITCAGILSACCFDAGGDWAMADLTEVPFMEGWNSEKFVRLRAAHLAKNVAGTPCEQCLAYA